MWLFSRYGFFSVACAHVQPGGTGRLNADLLMVRARQRRHLENLKHRFQALSNYEIVTNIGTDYRYRILVPKSVWSSVVAELVGEQTWSNFKDETARFLGPECRDYQDSLHRIWSVLMELQQNEPASIQPKRKRPRFNR